MKIITKIVPSADLNNRDQIKQDYPAEGQESNKCKKPNHFSKVCHMSSNHLTSHQLENLESDSSDSCYYMYPVKINEPINQVKHHSLLQRLIVSVKVNGVMKDKLTNSGAMVGLISSQHVNTFLPNVSLQPSNSDLMSCNRQWLQCLYEFKAKLEANNIHNEAIYVVQ